MRPLSRGCTPPRMFMVVDLPDPFSPTRPRTSPGQRVKPTSNSTCTPKKLLLSPSTASTGFAAKWAMALLPRQHAPPCGVQHRRQQDHGALHADGKVVAET